MLLMLSLPGFPWLRPSRELCQRFTLSIWVRYCRKFVGVLTVQFGGFCEVNLLLEKAENEDFFHQGGSIVT